MIARAHPAQFRDDVVARRRQAPLSQIAKDFRISDATLHSWLKRAGIEDGVRPTTGPLQGSDSRPPYYLRLAARGCAACSVSVGHSPS